MCICLVDVLSHGLCLSLPWLCTLVPAPRNLTNKTNKNCRGQTRGASNNVQIIVVSPPPPGSLTRKPCRGQTTGGGTKVYDHGKGFHSVLQAFYMFLWFLFYWVDIPEFIFWMNLWVLWKDTDVSISFTPRFFLCEALPMFQFVCTRCGKRCTNAGGLATKMKTHTKQKVDSPSLLRFFKRARLRKSRLNLSLWKRSHSKSNCGRNHAQSHFDLRKFHDLQHRLSHQKILPLLHQDDLDLLAHRRQIWATMLRLKALFLRIWTNDHQNFEWIMSDIFKNWRRMVFQC